MKDFTIDKTGWKKYRFDEVCRQVNGVSQNPHEEGLNHVVGLEHIEPENLHICHWNTLDKETTFTRKFVKGQVLFGRRRAYQRKVAYAEFDGICSGDILVFEAIEDRLIPELLPFIIQSEGFFYKALATSAGSLSPRTKFKELADYEFLLPPKAEQHHLAELLWAADNMVEKEKTEAEKMKELLQSLLKSKIEEGQTLLSFSDLVDINPYVTINDDLKTASFITMADVSNDGKIVNQEEQPISNLRGKGFTPFQEKDILFAKITPCMENGKGAIAEKLYNRIGFGSTEFHILRPKEESDLYFVYYVSKSFWFRKMAERQMTGSAGQKRVQPEFFNYFKFYAPNKEQRQNIGKTLHKIELHVKSVEQQIALSQRMKMELINKIF